MGTRFFSTTLDTLLEYLKARTLIVTGPAQTREALAHMRRVLKAELTPSTALDLSPAA